MPSYRVTGKHIYYTETQDIQMGTTMDGTPNIVRQPKYPMRRAEVGEIIEDPDPAVLAAAGDRLTLVDDATRQQYEARDPALAINAPLRGVHEPASDYDAVVHKPPLTAAEVEGKLQAQAEVGKVLADQEQQRAEMDKQVQETRQKAMEDATQQAVERQREPARQGKGPQPQGAMPLSTSSQPASGAQATGTTAPGTAQQPAAEEGGAARRRT
jgi:hypothetical protein